MNDKIKQLRQYMAEQNLDAVLIPRADEWQGEYVAAYAERLKWLTGFDGSAGMAAITNDKAALFVDGRYTVAAKAQVDTNEYEICQIPKQKLADWLGRSLSGGGRIGYDPWLFTADWIDRHQDQVHKKNISLVAETINPIDEIWQDQPPRPLNPIHRHDHAKAGLTADEKCQAVAKKITDQGYDVFLITAADSVSWLFNIRSSDVPHTPYVLSRALVYADGTAEFIVHPSRVTEELRHHLGNRISVLSPDSLPERLHTLGQEGKTLAVDKKSCPKALHVLLHDAHLVPKEFTDPCADMKATKTPAEIEGAKQAHLDDAVALIKFFKWVEEQHAKGTLSEITASEKLHDIRAQNPAFRDDSFDAIVGWNENGAIVHYRVTENTSLATKGDGLLLVDSGGQYDNGTTDITRTIALGTPTADMKDRYTRVLKGHIALACSRFPKGTSGQQLDILARAPLWQAGLDYAHGTGHGVGSYLSVHEGPASISSRGKSVPLESGMILSNEPGYYKEGEYGMRFENLMLVIDDHKDGDEEEMLAFETISLYPVETSLLDDALLTDDEKTWINAYHQHVYDALAPHLDAEHAAWLKDKALGI